MSIPDGLMINENQVTESIAQYLKTNGWDIKQQLNTDSKGVDIIASKSSDNIYIEVKGGTSSKSTSKRYGLPFTSNQAKSHIGVALWKAGETLTCYPNSIIAIGLPKEKSHIEFIKKIDEMISRLNIILFWVDENLQVEVEGNLK